MDKCHELSKASRPARPRITPSYSERETIKILSSAIEEYIHYKEQNYNKRIETWITNECAKDIENWLCNEYANGLQDWLVENFIPAFHKFNYWAAEKYSKTFKKILNNEEIEDTKINN